MNRAPWMNIVAIVLVALWLLTGVAWADPSGAANVPQILNVVTGKSASLDQQTRTFLTTDPIVAAATYYDPNAACAGVAPVLIQILFFNLEGQLLASREDAISTPIAIGSKYRIVSINLAPGALAANAYNMVWLVKDCTNVNFFVSGFYPIRVLFP
jgi:hypothetical protein